MKGGISWRCEPSPERPSECELMRTAMHSDTGDGGYDKLFWDRAAHVCEIVFGHSFPLSSKGFIAKWAEQSLRKKSSPRNNFESMIVHYLCLPG